MLTDSCNCERSGHGFKGLTRSHQPAWCSICDRNKVKRRQSEGLYQEGDPLKELNWSCDRGCDLLNRSSKCSSLLKKTELDMNEKQFNYTDDGAAAVAVGELEGGDSCYSSHHRKHHSRFHKEKQLQNSGCEINAEFETLAKSQRNHKYNDSSSPERFKPQMNQLENAKVKFHTVGDYQNCKSVCSFEKESSPTEMREMYLREMKILRNNLSLLKGGVACDGKRMRQRSESEPGFTELPGGVPKRARDNSPKIKLAGRKLPASPNLNQSLQQLCVRQNMPFRRDSKSLSPSSTRFSEKSEYDILEMPTVSVSHQSSNNEVSVSELDEEQDSIYNRDEVHSDDELSIGSNETSVSSDSNTPSKVGESLGSITLNEVVQQTDSNPVNGHKQSTDKVPGEEQTSQIIPIESEQLFRSSLFPNVPPYVKFFMHDTKGPTLPNDIRRHLKWRLSSITPIVIRRTLLNSGFKLVRSELSQGSFGGFDKQNNLIHLYPPNRNDPKNAKNQSRSRTYKKPVRESNDWTGQWGKHMKSFVFRTLKDFQKLNHFPGTFQIGRKDRLWKNMYGLMTKFGKKEFGFIPKTFILPNDRKLLRTAWEKASGVGKGQWILKPPAAARGTGIKVVHRWGQIPKKKSLIVQKYIAQPYLINGSKFDLRLYVLMTSIHPLRIYLYDDGLVRFASVKYSDDVECLSNRFMHLTNYSINKLSNQYQANADASSCRGHKWSLKSLWTYFANQGVNVKALKKNLTDLVIKTVISGESNINMLSKNNLPSRYCSYELFGIDVLLDQNLKPWLLEVNISPSLHSASPLDLAVKGPLVKELLNIAGFQIPAKLTREQEQTYLESFGLAEETHSLCYDKRLYWTSLSKEERHKQEAFSNLSRKEYLKTILDDLTPDDVRHLIQFEDELTQLCRFEKIFPTPRTHSYHQFFDAPRYYNMMLDAWETRFHKNRAEGVEMLSSLCQQKFHLNVPIFCGKAKTSPSLSESSVPELQEPEPEADAESKEGKDSDVDAVEDEDEAAADVPPLSPSSRSTSSGKMSGIRSKSGKMAVVSKPSGISTHLPSRKAKSAILPGKLLSPSSSSSPTPPVLGSSPGPKGESQELLNKTAPCFNVLAEMRQNGLNFSSSASSSSSQSQPDKLKQFPNCKLENSIVNESLNSGTNVLSPTKHMHNACIKMNTSN